MKNQRFVMESPVNEGSGSPSSNTVYSFVHLHVHSYFSILDGQSSIEGLVKQAHDDGMRGLALTDHGSMFGIKEFVNHINKINKPVQAEIKSLKSELESCENEEERAQKAKAVEEAEKKLFKPIIGCECYCARRGRKMKENEKLDRSGYHLVVLAKNLQGYKNLIKMVSLSSTEGYYYKPRIDKELLEKYHEGLIISSACLGGEVPQLIMAGNMDEAEKTVQWFKSIFGDDYYIEIQRHKATVANANHETYEKQVEVNKVLIELARKYDVKIICTNDVHFATEDDSEAHDRLICMNTKKSYDDPNRLHYTKQEWLKSQAEMSKIFGDIPEALTNTMEIFDKVEFYSIDHKPLMPDFAIPEGFQDDDSYLRHLSFEGAKKRYGEELPSEVSERLNFELETIKNMGFPGYFLIVQDFIQAARQIGVSVGPGRGSAAGSLVSYCLGITNLDPIKYDLLFERFLNPDRISLPDIDVDFDDDGRLNIIQWVTEKYGIDRVAHIITYGTMAAKSAIKDMARVVQLPLAESNRLAKLIPDRLPNNSKPTIATAIAAVPELNEAYNLPNSLQHETLEYAKRLEGTVRSTGVHACGIIIGKYPISDTVPVFVSRDSATGEEIVVTQYEGKVIEETGLIKMDFLGLKTLSIIKEALINIKKRHGIDLDIEAIPIDDEKTFQLFCDGHTSGVFQFESAGMQKYLKELQPSKFEDLIAMNALYRPGPMDYIPSFIKRKHGEEEITYDLPQMERYLKETYGITVYQEQVMLLSRELAGFTRGESDTLRKAMGKKQHDTMAKLKNKFIAGGNERGYPTETLNKIWEDWEKFAQYAFNKSHSTCYSWVAYQTAYLKANYPAEYMAGVLSRNVNNITEITKYIEECHKLGIEVLCPDVNESDYIFTVNSDGNIRFGMGAIKGISKSAVMAIVKEREENGIFKDVYDFFERVSTSHCTKKVCESLVLSGAFDSFGTLEREDYFYAYDLQADTFLEKLIKYSAKTEADRDSAQNSLFGDTEFQAMAKPVLDERATKWSDIEKLNKEKQLLGIYLTASPLDKYALVLKHYCNAHPEDLREPSEFVNTGMIIGGVVTGYREATTRKGTPCGFIKIQDFNGEGEIALFGDAFVKFNMYGKEGLYLLVKIKVEQGWGNTGRLFTTVDSIEMLDQVYEKLISKLDIQVSCYDLNDEVFSTLVNELQKAEAGHIKIQLTVFDPLNSVTLNMSSPKLSQVNVTPSFLDMLDALENVSYELN